ncbi:hypothetical protein CACET_c27290 [Clostridium aceticum]|uniref:Uncharacterized protein n=1 Tax=Clostridium aceticum TaxID=84022 RepID=A0A0D8I8H6_9CLOT|nr:DUF262 domain-containing protein [Clostridium aceticum]AKL96174.1 hypothetical protein CACET_c27290 [Clostridium aceticum]KJF26595.1 hypothetical protein TZ02_12015 [Clostridium aceticum]
MEARQIGLLGLLSGEDRRFIIPVFQRNYDWKAEQCIQLFKDIESVEIDEERKSHFLGTIVYISNSEVDMIDFHEYVLIDGQQRITTTILLLKALHDTLQEKEDKECINLRNRIYDFYLTNRYADEVHKFRLKPMIDDDVVFQRLMNNDFDFIDKTSRIYKNYILFIELINNSQMSVMEIFEGIKKLIVVYIGLKRGEDDPQLIFESLNSTGLSLSEADLIRNYILMEREPSEQEELYKKYWYKIEKILGNENISDFIRDYLTMKQNDIPNKNNIYVEFKKYVRKNSYQNIELILEDILYYSKIYVRFLNDIEVDKDIKEVIKDIRDLKVTVSYPFLMEVYSDYEQGIISKEVLINTYKLIETYVFRRLICDSPTNSLNKVFKNLAKELKENKDYENRYYDYLVSILLNKKYSAAFPLDSEFKHEFLTRNMYKFKHSRYLLEHLENENNKEKVDVNTLSIEHIMPQKLDAKWTLKLGNNAQSIHGKYLHNIGNLTLTGYNSNLSNKSFEDKKIILEKSRLKLNENLYSSESWNEEEIEKRANELFKTAIKCWKMPKVDEKLIHSVEFIEKEFFDLSDEIDVTGRKPIAFEILGQKHTVNSWKSFMYEASKILYNLEEKIFKTFVYDNDFSGRKSRIISSRKDMREPVQITDGIFIETNLNANSVLNYVKLMMEKYEMSDEDMRFWIK